MVDSTHHFTPGYARYKQAQTFFAMQMFCISWAFMVATELGVSSMAPNTFGAPAVLIDARIWALWLASGTFLHLAGIAINGRNRLLSSSLRLFGTTMTLLHFIALFLSSAFYGGQFVVATYSLASAMIFTFFAAAGVFDVLGAFKARVARYG